MIEINIHRLSGNEKGIEASTVDLFMGKYQSATGRNKYEAMNNLASKLRIDIESFEIHFDETK